MILVIYLQSIGNPQEVLQALDVEDPKILQLTITFTFLESSFKKDSLMEYRVANLFEKSWDRRFMFNIGSPFLKLAVETLGFPSGVGFGGHRARET
jgi:hypothetical protein